MATGGCNSTDQRGQAEAVAVGEDRRNGKSARFCRALGVEETGEQLGGTAAFAAIYNFDRTGTTGTGDTAPVSNTAREHTAQLADTQVNRCGTAFVEGDSDRSTHRRHLDQLTPGRLLGGRIGRQFGGAQLGVAAGPVHVLVRHASHELGVVVVQEGGFAVAAAHADVGGETGGQHAGSLVQRLWQGSTAAVDVSQCSLGRAQCGEGHGYRENVALKHEESPFVVFVRLG